MKNLNSGPKQKKSVSRRKKNFGNFDGGAKVGTGRRFWRQGAFERERRERECVRVCLCVCVGVRDCKIEGGRENVWMCV